MDIKAIEASVAEALDADHEPTLEAYAEYVADDIDMPALTEALCLAVIDADGDAWCQIMSVCLGHDRKLGEALAKIERHIDAKRKPFISAQAMRISDQAEFEMQVRGEHK